MSKKVRDSNSIRDNQANICLQLIYPSSSFQLEKWCREALKDKKRLKASYQKLEELIKDNFIFTIENKLENGQKSQIEQYLQSILTCLGRKKIEKKKRQYQIEQQSIEDVIYSNQPQVQQHQLQSFRQMQEQPPTPQKPLTQRVFEFVEKKDKLTSTAIIVTYVIPSLISLSDYLFGCSASKSLPYIYLGLAVLYSILLLSAKCCCRNKVTVKESIKKPEDPTNQDKK